MQVDFYQLGSDGVDAVLPRLAERVLGEGGRLLVVTGDEGQAERLDVSLWTFSAESFLAHARAGSGDEAAQPVLIAPEPTPLNGARAIALADGRWRDAALGFDRTFHLFDEEQVEAAREAWRGLGGRDDVTRNFWRQEGGRWTKVA